MSLEQPNSPGILLEQQQPQVEINLALAAEPVVDGIYEVAVTATVTTEIKKTTVFLVEVEQAGVYEIRNKAQAQIEPIIGHRLPADRLPLPARQRRGHRHPRGLPAVCA